MTTVKDKAILLIKNNIAIIFFLILVISDIFTKIFNTELNISKYSKALLIIGLILFSVVKRIKILKYIFLAFILFSLGSLNISIERFLDNIPQFFEYYFAIFFFIFLKYNYTHKLKSVLEIVFTIHSIIILLSAIFDIEFLKTYPNSQRFGFTSFFNSQNEFSYVMMAGVVFFTASVSKSSYLSFLKLFLFISASLLVGTKAIILFILLFYIFLFIKFSKPKIYITIFSLMLIVILIYSNNIILFLKTHYRTLYDLYINEGLVSFISSKRSIYFYEKFSFQNDELDFINYLFGGYNLKYVYEMSFFDLLGFFGLFGFTVFILILKNYVSKWFEINSISKIYILIVVGISIGAGYLFENASAQVYTILVFLVLKNCPTSNIFCFPDKVKENINE
jgi:hypothetical protein